MSSSPSSKLNRHTKGLIAILILGGLIRILYLYLYSLNPEWELLTVDNNFHHHWALSILNGNIMGDTTYFRAPFYIFYLAFIYKLFGISLWAVRISGLVLGCLSIFLTYKISRNLFDERIALLASAIHALYPIIIYFESELLLDSLFLLLVQFFLLYFFKFWNSRIAKDIFMAGLFLSLAAVTRPTILVLTPLIFITLYQIIKEWKQWVRFTSVFIGGLSLFILIVFVRNFVVASDPVLISSQGGINFYLGNNDAADGVSAVMEEPYGFNWRIKQISYEAESVLQQELKPGEVSSYWLNKTLNWIKENRGQFSRLFIEKIYHNISNREISNNRYLGNYFDSIFIFKYNPLSFGILLALFAGGFFIFGNSNLKVRFLYAVVIIYILTTALFFFSSRFRLPLIPIYIILSSNVIFYLKDHVRINFKKTIPIILVVCLSGFVSYYPLVSLNTKAPSHHLISQGLYHSAQGDNDRALELFLKAKQLDPSMAETDLNIGVAFLKMGIIDSAQHYFELEKSSHPLRVKSSINLASIHLIDKNYAELFNELDIVFNRRPYDLVANKIYLRAVFATETDPVKLTNAIDAASNRVSGDLYFLNEAGVLLSGKNLMNEAELILKRAIVASPPPIETDDEAFRHTSIYRQDLWNQEKSRAYNQLGFILGHKGSLAQSISACQKAVNLDSLNFNAYLNLISGHLSLNQLDQSKEILNQALEIFPGNAQLQNIRQQIYR